MPAADLAGSSPLSDPLLAAVIGKLPIPGKPYPAAQRVNWFKMMAIAMNEAYGVVDPINITALSAPAPAMPRELFAAAQPAEEASPAKPPAAVPPRYRIDAQGFALRGETPIDPQDVPPGTPLDDERSLNERGHLDTILWKTAGAIAADKLPPLQLRAA